MIARLETLDVANHLHGTTFAIVSETP